MTGTHQKTLLYVLADLRFFFSHRQSIALEAKAAGFDVHVACPGAARSEELRAIGISGHDLYIDGGGMNPLKDLRTSCEIFKISRKIYADIVQGIGLKSILPTALAVCLLFKVKAIYLFTGLGYLFTNNALKTRWIRSVLTPFLRLIFRRKNAVFVFQNADDCQIFLDKNLIHKRQAVIVRGSGVDMDIYEPYPLPESGYITVLMPSRLVGDKGVREFIEAAKILKTKQPHIKLKIAGDIDTKNPSHLTDKEIKAARPYVDFLGFQNDMKPLYEATDIVCLPSYREGLPLALLEAAACARPLIATDVPGCREIVRDGQNGILVPVRNLKALAGAIIKLSEDFDLRQKYGLQSRKYVESEFSSEIIHRQMMAIYSE